mgnify:CR=1 FL=1
MASNPFFESELFNELNDALKHSSRFTATYRTMPKRKKSPAASLWNKP